MNTFSVLIFVITVGVLLIVYLNIRGMNTGSNEGGNSATSNLPFNNNSSYEEKVKLSVAAGFKFGFGFGFGIFCAVFILALFGFLFFGASLASLMSSF